MAMELPRVVFFGRSGRDALQFFDLDLASWRGARLLDCPGGPGSLVATARGYGVEAVAVDPLYALPAEEQEERCRQDLRFTMERIAQSDALRDDFDQEAYGRSKLEALGEFLADRLAHPEAYVAASLPNLPFKAESFDLVLCGHLLFSYSPLADGGLYEDDRFALAWHQAALKELLRVSRHQVRIYPAHTASRPTKVHPYVEPLLAQLPAPWAGQLNTTAYDQGFEGPTPLLLLERSEAVCP
jgi:SAM-dependent methyltransferase